MSRVMCHMSHVTCHKVVKLFGGGGSVINGADPVSFYDFFGPFPLNAQMLILIDSLVSNVK